MSNKLDDGDEAMQVTKEDVTDSGRAPDIPYIFDPLSPHHMVLSTLDVDRTDRGRYDASSVFEELYQEFAADLISDAMKAVVCNLLNVPRSLRWADTLVIERLLFRPPLTDDILEAIQAEFDPIDGDTGPWVDTHRVVLSDETIKSMPGAMSRFPVSQITVLSAATEVPFGYDDSDSGVFTVPLLETRRFSSDSPISLRELGYLYKFSVNGAILAKALGVAFGPASDLPAKGTWGANYLRELHSALLYTLRTGYISRVSLPPSISIPFIRSLGYNDVLYLANNDVSSDLESHHPNALAPGWHSSTTVLLAGDCIKGPDSVGGKSVCFRAKTPAGLLLSSLGVHTSMEFGTDPKSSWYQAALFTLERAKNGTEPLMLIQLMDVESSSVELPAAEFSSEEKAILEMPVNIRKGLELALVGYVERFLDVWPINTLTSNGIARAFYSAAGIDDKIAMSSPRAFLKVAIEGWTPRSEKEFRDDATPINVEVVELPREDLPAGILTFLRVRKPINTGETNADFAICIPMLDNSVPRSVYGYEMLVRMGYRELFMINARVLQILETIQMANQGHSTPAEDIKRLEATISYLREMMNGLYFNKLRKEGIWVNRFAEESPTSFVVHPKSLHPDSTADTIHMYRVGDRHPAHGVLIRKMPEAQAARFVSALYREEELSQDPFYVRAYEDGILVFYDPDTKRITLVPNSA